MFFKTVKPHGALSGNCNTGMQTNVTVATGKMFLHGVCH